MAIFKLTFLTTKSHKFKVNNYGSAHAHTDADKSTDTDRENLENRHLCRQIQCIFAKKSELRIMPNSPKFVKLTETS